MTIEVNPEQAVKIAALLVENPVQSIPAPAPVVAAPAPVPAIPAVPVPQQTAPAVPVPTAPAPSPAAVPIAPAPTYDVEMLGRAAAPLAAQGKRNELFALLQSFGVQALTQLPPDKYGEMALKLRELGAQI